ncbi:MAG: ABC transporter ATP-binding protein [Bacillota bacterium]
MIQIQFKGVSKSYHSGQAAVSDLTLEVQRGEIYTLLGPSGCGKTTTLRLAAGFERPDRGRISIAGSSVAGPGCWVPPEKRGLGMVFQNYALFPHLNVEDNVAFGLRGLPARRRQARAGEFIELVGLSGYEKRYPHQLSGGQQQRVALARALCPGPLVVLLDEPFSNLDTDLKENMRIELRRIIKATGATAVLVTHDQKDALAISDRIMVMRSGTVQQVGDPRSIYLRPANRFVASFIGKSNILHGRVARDGLSVETEIGLIPYDLRYLKGAAGLVKLSVRPEGFELSDSSPIAGRVNTVNYLGSELECLVDVPMAGGGAREVLVRVGAGHHLSPGDTVFMRVLPQFVAVL